MCPVRQIKPYPIGDRLLYALHELDITDKHKLLVPLGHYAGVKGITVEDQMGITDTGSTFGIKGFGPYCVPIPWSHNIQNKGKFALTVLFEEGTPVEDFEVVDVLPLLKELALKTIEALEKVHTP